MENDFTLKLLIVCTCTVRFNKISTTKILKFQKSNPSIYQTYEAIVTKSSSYENLFSSINMLFNFDLSFELMRY